MQLRGEVYNLSFIFAHNLVMGTERGFKKPQLHLAKRCRQYADRKVSADELA
jgi:hypothetical protein